MADLIENCRRYRGMIGLLTVLGALLLGVRAQQQELRLEGSDVTLVPKYTGDLREIKWMLNDVIFVEIELKPHEKITNPLTNDRATINKTNGALTIRNLDRGDSGVYRAGVILMNNSIQGTEFRLTVYVCPDQPIISVESTEDQFVVSCKSFSPYITYEWFNPTTSVRKSQLYTEPKKNGTLTCVVDNKECKKNSSINFYIPDQPEVKSVGHEVILVPKYTGDPSEIIWKVNGDDLVDAHRIFHRLQDRAISETDGRLVILDLTTEDSGNYTAVVLVNNEYYYTEIRLTVLESSRLSGWKITGIVIGALAVIIIINFIFLLSYHYYKRHNQRGNDDQRSMTQFLLGGPNQHGNDDQKSETQSLMKGDDNNVENGNAAPAEDGNIEGVNGVEDGNAVGEKVGDDNNVENGNTAPPLDGNIEGVKGDEDDDVKKGIALVPMGKNVGLKNHT